jgi:hypothetical protein
MKKFYLIKATLLACLFLFNYQTQAQSDDRIPIRNGEQRIFASGINLAWGFNGPGDHNFSRDVISLPEYTFPRVFDDIQSAGGNTMRWWLHTNGRYSPDFDSEGKVTGLHPETINNMRTVLDMAHERGIVLSMCLWSFDMLQDQGQNQQVMKKLLEDPEFTQTYIDNALIPILEAIGDHPAVLTWEVFNEPEGMTEEFGWTPVRTTMKYVQQFTNLIAGAIHRTTPGALVSNGSWSFKAMTDVGGNYNYYTDERLIAEGGDPEGYLDFYQIHYYPEHFGNELSPFHNHASFWELDKPILIGEFWITGIDGKANPHRTTKEAYIYGIENGYAGCLTWAWVGDRDGSIGNAREGMVAVWKDYTEDVVILPDPDFNYPPKIIDRISSISLTAGSENITAHTNLKEHFYDDKEGSDLIFSVESYSDPKVAEVIIHESGLMDINLLGESGKTTITIKAADSQGAAVTTSFTLLVVPDDGNLALFKLATASSEEGNNHLASMVTDGDMDTRWSSLYSDQQWIYVDLGEIKKFDKVVLHWESAHAKEYLIQKSNNATQWSTVKEIVDGSAGKVDLTFPATEARYIRMLGAKRGTEWGYSLFEFQVYNTGSNVITAVEGKKNFNKIGIYPNPAESLLVIKNLNIGTHYILLKDLTGSIVYEDTFHVSSDGKTEIDIGYLSRGIYFLMLANKDQKVFHKIIKGNPY